MPSEKGSERERIQSDIGQFYENIKQIGVTGETEAVLDLAMQYGADAKFYLEKDDIFSAWGCISYAHGLIDTLRKQQGKL